MAPRRGRWRGAVGVALVAWLLTTAMMGAVQAEAPAMPEMPAAIVVPPARIGDLGRYEGLAIAAGDAVSPVNQAIALSFEWLQGSPRVDDLGRRRAHDALRVDVPVFLKEPTRIMSSSGVVTEGGPGWVTVQSLRHYPAGEATTNLQVSSAAREEEVPAPWLLPSPPGRSSLNATATFFRSPHSDCFLAAPWQGTTVATDRPLVLPAMCYFEFMAFARPNTTFHATGFDVINGWPAVRWHQSQVEQGDATLGMTFWLASGWAYPLRIQLTLPAGTGYELVRLDLAAFQPGHRPRSPDAGIAPPPLRIAARLPWGPDDTGVPHPFPLSAAWGQAMSSLEWPDLREYLDQHPQAATVAAKYAAYASGPFWTRSWSLIVSDGESHLDFVVSRTWLSPTSPPDALMLNDEGGSFNWDLNHLRWPAPELLPPALFTAASMLDRHAVHSGLDPGLEGTGWGFYFGCHDPCTEVEVHQIAGRHWFGDTWGALGSSMTRAWSELDLHQDGRARKYQVADWNHETPSIFAPPREPPPVEMGAAETQGTAALALGWVPMPSASATAGTGLLAAAIGLLYWLWPTAKAGGLLGLLSRLRHGQALDHPQRVRLLALVQATPGIHLSALARSAGLARTSVRQHMRRLVAASLVRETRQGEYVCYVPAGQRTGHAALLSSHGARAVWAGVKAQPGTTSADLAKRHGLAPATVHHHVKRLEAAGLVRAVRDGRSVRLHASDPG